MPTGSAWLADRPGENAANFHPSSGRGHYSSRGLNGYKNFFDRGKEVVASYESECKRLEKNSHDHEANVQKLVNGGLALEYARKVVDPSLYETSLNSVIHTGTSCGVIIGRLPKKKHGVPSIGEVVVADAGASFVRTLQKDFTNFCAEGYPGLDNARSAGFHTDWLTDTSLDPAEKVIRYAFLPFSSSVRGIRESKGTQAETGLYRLLDAVASMNGSVRVHTSGWLAVIEPAASGAMFFRNLRINCFDQKGYPTTGTAIHLSFPFG